MTFLIESNDVVELVENEMEVNENTEARVEAAEHTLE